MKFPGSFTIISDEISQDPAEVAQFLRQGGLNGFELRSMFGRAFRDLTPQDIAAIGTMARDGAWRIHGCASPVFKCPLEDTAAINEHLDLFKRALDVTRALDCQLVRVFTFLRQPGPLDQATVERIAAHLHCLREIADGSGVQIGVENECSCLIGTDEELLMLAPLLPAMQCGIIWDPCNALYVSGAPAPSPATFERLLTRILHVHVKDAARSKHAPHTTEALPVGLGEVDWRAHLAAIHRSGYGGLLSLETHWRREKIDAGLLHLPAGEAFSRGGNEASRTCLDNLQALCSLLV